MRACSLHYDQNGHLELGLTRGDGRSGEDISENVRQISDVKARVDPKIAKNFEEQFGSQIGEKGLIRRAVATLTGAGQHTAKSPAAVMEREDPIESANEAAGELAHADIVIAHRPWDYHPDHRYVGVLVQDAAYMVTVPFFCPDVPAMRKNPVFMYYTDRFQKPAPSRADVIVNIDPVLERKLDALGVMISQFAEGGANGNAQKKAYYEPFEKARIVELADCFPDRADALMDLHGRIVDLLPIVRNHVYDRDFRGSFSLKTVLPALVPELGYDDLAIQDGGQATAAIYRLLFDESLAATAEAELRRDFTVRQVGDPYGESTFLSRTVVTRLSKPGTTPVVALGTVVWLPANARMTGRLRIGSP